MAGLLQSMPAAHPLQLGSSKFPSQKECWPLCLSSKAAILELTVHPILHEAPSFRGLLSPHSSPRWYHCYFCFTDEHTEARRDARPCSSPLGSLRWDQSSEAHDLTALLGWLRIG